MIRPCLERPDLAEKIAAARAVVDAMTPAERGAMRRAQRASWVRGEMGMGSDADEAEYADALRSGDHERIAECERKSRELVAAADAVLHEQGLL